MSGQDNGSKLMQELKVIPRTAWVVAAVLLGLWLALGMPLALHFIGQKQKSGEPPLWFLGAALAFGAIMLLAVVLLIVYVNFDARRRQMNRALWTLLVIFIPYAIGFVFYFLLRRPLPQPCPQCQEPVLADYVVCPACGHKLVQQCPSCHRKVERGWLNCAYCGAKLS